MAPKDFLSPAGPMFGPNFVVVAVNDDNGRLYQLQVYPDARNGELKAAGLPQHFYFQPGRAYVAKLVDSPDYDFGMTIFKGLMTSETHVGVEIDETTNGNLEAGGGFCTFSTEFAVPANVLQKAAQKLKNGEHDVPVPRLAHLFRFDEDEPTPRIGMIPMTECNVTIAVPDLMKVGPKKSPMYISAQGQGKGSIEAQGHQSFLVTCDQLAAGAIAGSLEDGKPPFVVTCELKEQFYIEACRITVEVDVDKAYDSVSTAISTGGFLGINTATLNAAWSSMRTNGGITTKMEMNSTVLTDDLKKWIEENVEDTRKKAWELVKKDIFDWDPSAKDTPAGESDRGFFSSLFGGSSVALKANFQRRSIKYTDTIEITDTVSVIQSVDGNLNDMMEAVRADLGKYLAVIDIGEHFKKIQVCGMSAVDFNGKLADGTQLGDPLVSVQLEAGYPDYDRPLLADGTVNLVTRGQGFHYTIGKKDPNGDIAPVVWTEDNPKDVVDVSWLRLDEDVDGWPADQVRLRQTLIYNGSDPRVDLSNGGLKVVLEEDTRAHAPIITPDRVGYVYVHLLPDITLPKDNVSAAVTLRIGERSDTLTITRENQRNVVWQVFSDKFIDETEIEYEVEVTVAGPGFTDPPVTYKSERAIKVEVPEGRVKYINPLKIKLPPAPAKKRKRINRYIAKFPGS